MKMKLAEALLRRKELQAKVDQLTKIKTEGLFEVKVQRRAVHEGIDDVIAQVPKVSIDQLTHAFDWHARQLRRVDAAIQQTNWTAEVEVPEEVNADYVDPFVKR